jgi:hypothetical protein
VSARAIACRVVLGALRNPPHASLVGSAVAGIRVVDYSIPSADSEF